jgi:hypothetical protein
MMVLVVFQVDMHRMRKLVIFFQEEPNVGEFIWVNRTKYVITETGRVSYYPRKKDGSENTKVRGELPRMVCDYCEGIYYGKKGRSGAGGPFGWREHVRSFRHGSWATMKPTKEEQEQAMHYAFGGIPKEVAAEWNKYEEESEEKQKKLSEEYEQKEKERQAEEKEQEKIYNELLALEVEEKKEEKKEEA